MTTKSPVDSAREFLEADPEDRNVSYLTDIRLHIHAVIKYAESLERELEELKREYHE